MNTDRLAYIDNNGVVTRVILADPSFDESAIPCNYPVSAGYIYNAQNNLFYSPQPYASWTMASDGAYWVPPTPRPEDGAYQWNEDTISWELVNE